MTSRRDQSTRVVDHRPNGFRIVGLARDQDSQVVRQSNQSTIKHPVGGSGKGDAVAYNVRPVAVDRYDVGGLDFGAATAVNQLESGDCTTLVVRTEHGLPEVSIPYDAVCELVHPIPGTQRVDWQSGLGQSVFRMASLDAGWYVLIPSEAPSNDSCEVCRRQRTDRSLGAAGYPAMVIEKPLFENHAMFPEGNRVPEVEVCARFDQGQKHVLMVGVFDDFLDLGDGKVALGASDLGWFKIDDPIPFTLPGAGKVLPWKLVFP